MRAFSLVELSIVLVILGLLTGGILTGQSLIRAAELRAVTAEYQRYQGAIHTFRDKYMALPGDMATATRFWNQQANQSWCAAHSGAAVSANGTCNGNGNGSFQFPSATGESGEAFQFWRQLALSGLIEGNYTGLSGSLDAVHADPGNNTPASKIGSSAGWSVRQYVAGNGHTFSNWTTANTLTLGASPAMNADGDDPVLLPSEMWNFDTKLDDGLPAHGAMQSYDTRTRSCVDSDDPATARYLLASTDRRCTLLIRL